MPYIKKTVIAGGNVFIYKHFSFRYGKKVPRGKKCGTTPPKQREVNRRIQADKNIWEVLENFKKGDYWIEFNYRRAERPDDIEIAYADIENLLHKLARKLKAKGIRFTYKRMTELGEYGAVHHHLIVKNNFDIGIITRFWDKGKVIIDDIYSENLIKLAEYFAKGRKETNEKKYSKSRNIVTPEPIVEVMTASSWRKEVKPQKGYEIYNIFNGYHDTIGYEYQRVIMRRIC